MSIWKLAVLCFAAAAAFACSDDANDDSDTSNSQETDNGDAGDGKDSDTDEGTDTGTEDDFVPDPEADVCNFTDAVTLGEPDEDGMVLVPPNHPEIQYFGRVDCSDPSTPAFGFPGVSIRAKFDADSIEMILDDGGNATQPNFYNIIVDDGEPTVLEMTPDEYSYTLAADLEEGEHTVEVYKRNESNGGSGFGAFLGFKIPEGYDLLPLSPRPYRLEVIGDSISCGYGNEISTDDPGSYSFTTTNSNAYSAWAAIAARDLDAEYMAVAYSGRGVVRNYSGRSGATVPAMYLKSIPDGSSAEWDIHQFTPDVLTINLGTNDFSVGLDIEEVDSFREEFSLGLLEFVETLRGYYPRATIILAEGPMLSDGYPAGFRALTSVREAMEAIVAARAADGDENVHYLDLGTHLSGLYGEDWHPTVETHQNMAEILMGFIDELELM